MKTNYLGIHEERYKKLKKTGAPGWGGDANERIVQKKLRKVSNALQRESLNEFGKLLELGCGDGSVTLPLAQRGFKVYGIDISPTAISWAQENAQAQDLQADFRVGNVVNLPYTEGFFDLAIDADCSHCVIGEDRKAFFSGVIRVLKCGGYFILMSLCGDPIEEVMKRDFDPITRYIVRDGVAGRYYGLPEGILGEMGAVGFHIIRWEVKQDPTTNQEELSVVARKTE